MKFNIHGGGCSHSCCLRVENMSVKIGSDAILKDINLHILKAMEEESGSEASAAELIEIAKLVDAHALPAIFTERSGSNSAADIISRETGVKIFTLDMAMSGDSYFDAMYHNIDTLKEALQ